MTEKIGALLVALFVFCSLHLTAQNADRDTVVLDVIHTKDRGIQRGEILSFNESNGVVVFKDQQGRRFTFSQKDYHYFEENVEVRVRHKTQIFHPRKSKGYSFSAGTSAGYFWIDDQFQQSANFIESSNELNDLPICIQLGLERIFDERQSVRLAVETSLFAYMDSYSSVGLQYKHLFHPSQNVSFYLPIELKLSTAQFDTYFTLSDTIFYPNGWSYPTHTTYSAVLNSAEFHLGQGMSISLKDQKSIQMELLLFKQFTLSQQFKYVAPEPLSELFINGIRFTLYYSF